MNFTTNPYKVIFYEKDGCAGNARQKKLLQQNGISFETKSILNTIWDKETLQSFFEGLDNDQIINQFAPAVKKGEIDISDISKNQLIDMMCKDPILIKRPLLQIGERKICGFDIEKINELLGTQICDSITISTCQSSDPCTSA